MINICTLQWLVFGSTELNSKRERVNEGERERGETKRKRERESEREIERKKDTFFSPGYIPCFGPTLWCEGLIYKRLRHAGSQKDKLNHINSL